VVTLPKVRHSIDHACVPAPRYPEEYKILNLPRVPYYEKYRPNLINEATTLLLHAIRNEDIMLVKFLLNSGATWVPRFSNNNKRIFTLSALEMARFTGNEQIIKLLNEVSTEKANTFAINPYDATSKDLKSKRWWNRLFRARS
jgi:hypothetical protein